MALQRRSRTPVEARARDRGPVAAVVAARRQDLSLTQGEVADLAGVARGPVVALEGGRNVSIDVLLAVLDVLGLHLEVARGTNGATVDVSADLAVTYGLSPDPNAGRPHPTGQRRAVEEDESE